MLRSEKTKARSAAITIAESARLNMGQCGSSIQSITWPLKAPCVLRKIRSVRFPNVPPRTNPITIAQWREVMREAQIAMNPTTTIPKIERNIAPPVAMLKAAPELRVNVNCKKLPSTFLGLLPSRLASAQVFVATSRSHTTQAASRTLRQIGTVRRKISAVLPFVCRACTRLRVGILGGAPSRWNFHILHKHHKSFDQCARGHVLFARPCPVR